jgi:hypothetical protein
MLSPNWDAPQVNIGKREPSGSVVFKPLKDDTGKFSPPTAGKATLRNFSKGDTNVRGTITQGPSVPTIDLQPDDDDIRHSTPGYSKVTEVKFSYTEDKDDKDSCLYFTQNQQEEEERRQARLEVQNIIAGYPRKQRTPESQPQRNFTPPNIDFGELGPFILGIPGAVIREFIRER